MKTFENLGIFLLVILFFAGCSGPVQDKKSELLHPSVRILARDTGKQLEKSETSELSLPLRLDFKILGHFGDSRGKRKHKGADLFVSNKMYGLGSEVLAVGPGRVTVAYNSSNWESERGGKLIKDKNYVERRGKKQFPAKLEIEGVGTVYPFSENYGKGLTGLWVEITHETGELSGYKTHYMHLAEVLVKEGDLVKSGQPIALLGATAILVDCPHLHFALKNPEGRHIDPEPLLKKIAGLTPLSVLFSFQIDNSPFFKLK